MQPLDTEPAVRPLRSTVVSKPDTGGPGPGWNGSGDRVVAELAPAKLNLLLRVVGRRPDGYHELVSVMQTVGLADRVQVALVPEGRPGLVEVFVAGPRAEDLRATGVPLQERLEAGRGGSVAPALNLAARAARALQERCGRMPLPAVRIGLVKRIPVAAGLGGGSSDAAAVLRALNRLWELGLAPHQLEEVAAGLGADVPFLVRGGTQLARGIGERLTPVPCRLDAWCVIACPQVAVRAADVYREWDRERVREAREEDPAQPGRLVEAAEADAAAMARALEDGDFERVCALVANDLGKPAQALCPAIGPVQEALRAAGLGGVAVSGSGPAVFGLAPERRLAEEAAARVRRHLRREGVASQVRAVRLPPGGVSGS